MAAHGWVLCQGPSSAALPDASFLYTAACDGGDRVHRRASNRVRGIPEQGLLLALPDPVTADGQRRLHQVLRGWRREHPTGQTMKMTPLTSNVLFKPV